MSDLVKELMSANERGVSPPQDWTHIAIDEICRQQAEIKRLQALIAAESDSHNELQIKLQEAMEEIERLNARVKELEHTMYSVAAGIAKEVGADNIDAFQYERLYSLIQELKKGAKS